MLPLLTRTYLEIDLAAVEGKNRLQQQRPDCQKKSRNFLDES
jgi:hypothetical protein